MVSVNHEATAKLVEFFRQNPDVVAEIHRVLEEIGCVGTAVPEPFCPCCSQGNHDMMCNGTCGVKDCCHPLYHTDRDAADEQRTAELHERMRIMKAQDARVDWEADPRFTPEPAGPLPPFSDDPAFLVHAFAVSGTLRRCGAADGRTTVRRDAIECPECFELTRPEA